MKHFASALVVALILWGFAQTLFAEPEYVMGQAMTVNVAGQKVPLAAGQAVTLLSSANGNAMLRLTLPGGSLGLAQVPLTALRLKPTQIVAPPTPAPTVIAPPTPSPASMASATPASTAAPLQSAPPGFSTWKPDPKVEALAPDPGRKIYEEPIARKTVNEFAVYIPASYRASTPMPLLVDAHGNGGSGPNEIGQWEKFAEEIGFIVVCPSFRSSKEGDDTLPSDEKMLSNVMKRVFGSLNIDQRQVLFTGFSGGGIATWYLATKESKIFTALCFRSANYHGEAYNLNSNIQKWRHRPVYLYLAEQDAPGVTKENPAAVAYLQKKIEAKNFKYEKLPLNGHQSRPEYAAKWFQSLIEGQGTTTSP